MLNQKSETCEEKLQGMVKSIAEDISNYGDSDSLAGMLKFSKEYEVYAVEWITSQDHKYKAARLMVAGGGPNIWINLQTAQVEGYWARINVFGVSMTLSGWTITIVKNLKIL